VDPAQAGAPESEAAAEPAAEESVAEAVAEEPKPVSDEAEGDAPAE
jgi:hypothetical protein